MNTRMEVANIDRGYAWVVLVAAFCLQFLVGLLAYSPGVMNIAMLDEIENDLTKTSWVGSINFGTCTLLGPVAGLIQDKVGSRGTALMGATFTFLGMTSASFCRSIVGLVLTYGFISGFGLCLACNVVGVVAGNYFLKRREIAYGVCSAGGGMGLFVSGPLVRYLLRNYNLSGTLLLLGAVEFHMCVAGVTFRPVRHGHSQSMTVTPKEPAANEIPDESDSSVHQQATNAEPLLIKKIEVDDTNEFELTDQRRHGSISSSHDKVSLSPPLYHPEKKGIKARIGSVFIAFRIFKQVSFLMYNISLTLWTLAESAAVFHLPYYTQLKGSSSDQAATVFTAMGFGSVISRISAGLITSDSKIPHIIIQVGLLGISGMIVLFFPLYSNTYSTQLVFGILYGTYSQGINTLIGPIVLDLVSLKEVPVAYGFAFFFQGIGYILGPPVASWIYKLSGAYDFTYVFAGSSMVLSSVLAAAVGVVRRKDLQRMDARTLDVKQDDVKY
ncbi:monocarboxylate transporter 14-like [Haliotis rubra]|uniref:monocarboxylate transporter 14-like n=1 Tax=Haliotis rubra TaxID=36100 RepID=UPI001EE62363|nr:monocarboxylate transporter 14-like [Haliotis rubra]